MLIPYILRAEHTFEDMKRSHEIELSANLATASVRMKKTRNCTSEPFRSEETRETIKWEEDRDNLYQPIRNLEESGRIIYAVNRKDYKPSGHIAIETRYYTVIKYVLPAREWEMLDNGECKGSTKVLSLTSAREDITEFMKDTTNAVLRRHLKNAGYKILSTSMGRFGRMTVNFRIRRRSD